VKSKSKEKRRSPRKQHDSVLEAFDDSGHLITGIGRLVDFSTVGACFSSTKSFEKNSVLHVRLRLLKEGPIEITARVVWVRRKVNLFLYGIEFEKVVKK
jgi:hypothetical protein